MERNSFWKWAILAGLVVVSLTRVIPWSEKVTFGLDLAGGISFICSIDKERTEAETRAACAESGLDAADTEIRVNEALKGDQEQALEVLRNRLNGLGIAEPSIVAKGERIEIQLPGVGVERSAEAEESILSVGELQFRMAHPRNDALISELMESGKVPAHHKIVKVGNERLFVRTEALPINTPEDAAYDRYRRELARFQVPTAKYEFMLVEDVRQGAVYYRPYFMAKKIELGSQELSMARVGQDQMGLPAVDLEFTNAGRKRFAAVTRAHAPGGTLNPDMAGRHYMGIVIDGTLYSAPYIREAITGANAQISGNFNMEDAKRLVNVLRSGALPTRIKVEEKRFVDPSLGEKSIRSSFKALMLGGLCVLVFMLVYYMFCGFVADVALAFNIVLLPLGMVFVAGLLSMGQGMGGKIGLPTLTLPGIAGILLTIGMAVDANVLIFERVREESRVGKSLKAAIAAGYERAFVTIFDANLTTLMTGIILFWFGSGPIRGFAVTLCAGIIVSMYTALVVTRMIFTFYAGRSQAASLKMLQLIKSDTAIDFIGKRKVAAAISIMLIVATWALMGGRYMQAQGNVLGVDFTGGAVTVFEFNAGSELPGEDAIRAELEAAGIKSAMVQYQREADNPGVVSSLRIKTGVEDLGERSQAEVVKELLPERFPAPAFRPVQEDLVGPQVGAELRNDAVISILIALAVLIAYITIRFEFGFAVGAIVALAHDVLITLGLFTLFGRQINLPIVAALLTIVGYSINDTIVVFDRIREDLKVVRGKGFRDICNLSINQTLGRTLLTSLTTLIVILFLLVFGGGAIFDFALALCIGVIVGTYSSIFVATPVVLLRHGDKAPVLHGSSHKIK
jgi:SecD/SecF fusion protein